MSQPPPMDDPGLTQFLKEEVRAADFADFLVERTEAVLRGEPVPGASCNAFYVAFAPTEITIEHHYLEDWPVAHIPPARFLAALRAWRGRLA
jgi:hypothetical protein